MKRFFTSVTVRRMDTHFLLGGDVTWRYAQGWFCNSLLVDQRAEISAENTVKGHRGETRPAHRSMRHLAASRCDSFQVAQTMLPLTCASFVKKSKTALQKKNFNLSQKIIQSTVWIISERWTIMNQFSPFTDRPTPALDPISLHCWGKPPSSFLGSAVTWPSPAAAPQVPTGSSSPRQRSAASICWPSAPHRRTGCRRIKTWHPAISGKLLAEDINNLTWRLLSSRLYLTWEREPSFCAWELLEQLNQSFCLFDTRDGFKRQNISFCCCKAFDLWPMPCFKLLERGKK